MNSNRAVSAIVVASLAALLGLGIWLIFETPGTLVNEEPLRQGPALPAEPKAIPIEVAEGDSSEDIGRTLEEAGVIQSARLFRVLAALMGLEDKLEAGNYDFQQGETALAAVRRISEGRTRSLRITIPEGWRLEEIGQLVESRGIATYSEFLQALDEQYSASFLSELAPGTGLEGFLFPATYELSFDANAHDVIQRLLAAFDRRYQDEMLPKLAAVGLSLRDVVNLASIVEREARVPEDRPLIAGVFLNRMRIGMALNADPTVQYAITQDPASVEEFGYWKLELTLADLALPSAYNTYVNAGLPPGPIANPGLASILAVLEPAETEFFYFVARPDGSHIFAETFAEHERNVCRLDPSRREC